MPKAGLDVFKFSKAFGTNYVQETPTIATYALPVVHTGFL